MNSKAESALFRMIVPAYPHWNIYSRTARETTALGPVSVATVVSGMEGWSAEVIDENNYRNGPSDDNGGPNHNVLQVIRPAQVVGFYGGMSCTAPRLYSLARSYKAMGVTTMAGGQHFAGDNIREALDNGVDFVVIGDGEETIRDLLGALSNGRRFEDVAGIAFKRNGNVIQTAPRPPVADLDSLPLADFRLARYAKISIFPIAWIRGCGMNCEFCTVKGRPRPASAERVVRQIASLVETCKARYFFIVDDLFGQFRAETIRLCNMLAEYQRATRAKLDITVQIRLDRARDTELLQAMRLAGITSVCIGFESPIPDELKAMNKKLKPEDMLEMSRAFHKAGFFIHGMFIFGYPQPDGVKVSIPAAERVRHFRRFIRKARLDTIQVLLPVPLPGTAMTERLEARNRIFSRAAIGWEYYDGNFPLFRPDEPLTAEAMQRAIRGIMGRFYPFRSVLAVALNVVIFPTMLLSALHIIPAWQWWRRKWRNALIRTGGWLIVKRWTAEFKKGAFTAKLALAQQSQTRAATPQCDAEGWTGR